MFMGQYFVPEYFNIGFAQKTRTWYHNDTKIISNKEQDNINIRIFHINILRTQKNPAIKNA